MDFNNLSFKIVDSCDLDILSQIARIENSAFQHDGLSIFNLSLLARMNSVFTVVYAGNVLAEAQFIVKHENKVGLILGFAVKKQYQGQKIGKFLLKNLIDYAQIIGISSIILTVNPANATALHLYKDSFRFIVKDKNICHPSNNEKRWLLEKQIYGAKN